ncbi:MAG: signal peptidase I [bacterium]|nr:signal peptidase I [bacterium]
MKVIYWLVLAVLILVPSLTVGNYKMFTVLSGSMEPAIKTGSIVVVKPQPLYQTGDVITFREKNDSKITTTHRIFGIEDGRFVTKGDANNSTDSTGVADGQIIGKTIFSVPYLGYPVSFTKTQQGLLLLVIIPSIIIIYSEILTIKNEIMRMLKKDR